MTNKFYTVTVFEGDESVELMQNLPKTTHKRVKYSAYGSKRTMFVLLDVNEAKRVVSENISDIHECLYNYCVIEEYQFGCVYGDYSKFVALYEYNLNLELWQEVNIPTIWVEDCDAAKEKYTFANFSIG
jgi:hypothetical protein